MRTAYATVAIGLLCALGAHAEPDLKQLGYDKGAVHTVRRDRPADLELAGEATHLHVAFTLEPDKPVAKWKAASQAAREKGDRLPDKLTVADLIVTYADGRVVTTNVRYNESVGDVVRDWWNPVDGFIYHLAFADVVWTKPLEAGGLRHAAVYRMKWPNPRPNAAIRSVALKPAAGLGDGKLLVFAASTRTTPATGATYFVAPKGDDAADGFFDRPWATLHKAATTIKAGDTVYVRGGTWKPKRRVVFKYLDAPEGRRTRIVGWPGETAEFNFMDAHWDTRPERRNRGFEVYPHDQSMIMAYDCDRFTFKNLHLSHSRARGFGMDTGWSHYGYKPAHLIKGGEPEQVNNNRYEDSEIVYCSVYRVFSAGIRFSMARNGRLIGNVLMRPESISMGPRDTETAGFGPVAGLKATTYIAHDGTRKRNPGMEGIDCGKFADCVVAYNEIAWPDKECMLVDGNVDGLRAHHNYVHDAWNLPWVGGISPNGYGRQKDIEIDHNIAHNVGGGFGIGTEGGGFGRNARIHHNLTWDCHWTGGSVTGAWKGNANLYDISMYNNTHWHNGHYTQNPRIAWRENKGPAGGIVVSFAAKDAWVGPGKPRRPLRGVVEDVTIANNLILQPRDYALALKNEGDPVKSRIFFLNNMTDSAADSALIDGKNNPSWHAVRDDKLIVTDRPVLRDPAKRDFRLLPGTPAVDGGIPIGPDGKPDPKGGKTYIGAFGPDSKWVELPPESAAPEDAPGKD
jgi:hypothetical protein